MPFVRTDAREDRLAGPIRGELLGAEHLAERAHEVAASQRIAVERVRRTPLLARLNDTKRILEEANRRLTASGDADADGDGIADVGPAGEWLLDNYYIIADQIAEIDLRQV